MFSLALFFHIFLAFCHCSITAPASHKKIICVAHLLKYIMNSVYFQKLQLTL